MTPARRSAAEEFLLSCGAAKLAHPGGTLYEHLCRVADLLASWGAGARLQTAGLCHACYGTDGYGQALIPVSQRPRLAALIGRDAESLVYLYGSCDRAAVYPRLGDDGPVLFKDRFTGQASAPPEHDVRAFAELTAANELDVICHNPSLASQHGPALLDLVARSRHRLSLAAWRAWAELELAGRDGPVTEDPAASPIRITGLDHVVLTVADQDRAIAFYRDVVGMRPVSFGGGRWALEFGPSKINLHETGHEIAPHAARPVPGSADFCLVTITPLDEVRAHLRAHGVAIEAGPALRTGARGPMTSVYIRDPDRNLVEIASYEGVPAGA